MKSQIIGHGATDMQEGRVLNRIIRAVPNDWEVEGDQRHAELITRTFHFEASKAVATPGEDAKKDKEEEESHFLERKKARKFYDARQARHPVAVKELSRAMSAPTMGHWRQMKRAGRYLKGGPVQ